ncbi:MAG: C1 family peptidase [Fibromonadaceae bacterium]|jgi:C1A family cysteine protease|nr:C1 family peptidase [Fibromonadaceae bacterium]
MLRQFYIYFFALYGLILVSCGSDESASYCPEYPCRIDEGEGSILRNRTGWQADKEDISDVHKDEYIPDGLLPERISLEDKFPPIGNQGQYGTCVAWATGYNLKTSLNAAERGWSSAELSDAQNQTSPKDLWFAIDNSKKGTQCGGASIVDALNALVSKGAASVSSVPYKDLGNCFGPAVGDEFNRLASYSVIAYNYALVGKAGSRGMALENFKGYLSQGIPILIGAKLGDRFVQWNSASVISSDTYNDPNMQNAFHAMVLVGYDDGKEAFRVRNAWGAAWGDEGSIWVDYDFFLGNFCFMAFIAKNQQLIIIPF